MNLFKDREDRRAIHPTLGTWVKDQAGATCEDELGFLGLIPEPHRADYEFRHAHPLAPDHWFTPDPHPLRADIA